MTTATWKNSASGLWRTASNWSTGKVPVAGDVATIDTFSLITVTVASGNNQVAGLFTSSADALALTGGTLSIGVWGELNGNVTQSGKTSILSISGLGTAISGVFKQTAGTVKVQSGTFSLPGGGSIAGTISGAGWLEIGAVNMSSNTTIESGATLTVANVLLPTYIRLALGANLKYAGNMLDTAYSGLLLNGKTATLSGTVLLEGSIVGGGLLALTSAAVLSGATIESGATLDVSGTTTIASTSQLGLSSSAATYLNVLKGGQLVLAGAASLASSGGQFGLAGTLLKTGSQTSTIDAAISASATSTISIAAGTLDLGGAYGYTSPSSLAGTIGGAGTLQIGRLDGYGAASIAAHTTLSVAALVVGQTGILEIRGSDGYAGPLAVAGEGTLTVDSGATLTLTNAFELDGTLTGGGVVVAGGVLEISQPQDNEAIDGSATLDVTGTATQSSRLYVGYSSSSTAVLDVKVGATWTDHGAEISGIGTIENAGTFIFAGNPGIASISANLVNTGTVQILSGGLALDGSVSGGGSYQIEAGASLQVSGGAFPQATAISFAGPSAELLVNGTGTFSVDVAHFAAGDVIDLIGNEAVFSQPTVTLQGGVLTVANQYADAHIALGSGVTLANLLVIEDGGRGTAIVHI